MITKEQVLEAQKLWGEGVISIGSLIDSRHECELFASEFLDKRYDFESGNILFKPTKCQLEQFRPTKAEALSYFIAGSDRACQEDSGFALKPWVKVRFENTGFILNEDRGIAMGNYFFTDLSGDDAKVVYTFGYKLVGNSLKINVHHSSFPYSPTTFA